MRLEDGGRKAKFVRVQKLGWRCRPGSLSTNALRLCRGPQHRRVRWRGSIEDGEERVGRALLGGLAQEGRAPGRPLGGDVELLGRLTHHYYRDQVSWSL